jgi:hypothetical protein
MPPSPFDIRFNEIGKIMRREYGSGQEPLYDRPSKFGILRVSEQRAWVGEATKRGIVRKVRRLGRDYLEFR